ncbi:hypothetical protein [Halalkalibaculum sp. DA384]|uniref:hypothetical protein n=1 Tax=Halalkalibaculum sp. DA384 TaxID=3373606 RepID=UPI003754FDCA
MKKREEFRSDAGRATKNTPCLPGLEWGRDSRNKIQYRRDMSRLNELPRLLQAAAGASF